jgi:hypothetical protein
LVDHITFVYKININPEEMMVYYSGNRGFHVTVNAEVFGAEPMVDMIKVWRVVAEMFYKTLNLETMDRAVYTRRRAWRVPNTTHGKTGLYKRALTYEELMGNALTGIQELAKSPCEWLDLTDII